MGQISAATSPQTGSLLSSIQQHQIKDRRGFVRQEWAKLRDRNEALDCAVLARAALWLLGADRYGERFWQRLREDVANAPVDVPQVEATAALPAPASSTEPPPLMRRPGWLAPRGNWLR
jgi:phage terminase large subunit GpA-like protein